MINSDLHKAYIFAWCVWQGSSKTRAQRDNSEISDSSSSICTVNSSLDQPCLEDPLPASAPLRPTSPLKWAQPNTHSHTGSILWWEPLQLCLFLINYMILRQPGVRPVVINLVSRGLWSLLLSHNTYCEPGCRGLVRCQVGEGRGQSFDVQIPADKAAHYSLTVLRWIRLL